MAKDMENGSKAVGLFNTTEIQTNIEVLWEDLGIEGRHRVRDLWRQENLGTYKNQYEANVPRHGVSLVRIVAASSAK
jgi:alpha-galactosidase